MYSEDMRLRNRDVTAMTRPPIHHKEKKLYPEIIDEAPDQEENIVDDEQKEQFPCTEMDDDPSQFVEKLSLHSLTRDEFHYEIVAAKRQNRKKKEKHSEIDNEIKCDVLKPEEKTYSISITSLCFVLGFAIIIGCAVYYIYNTYDSKQFSELNVNAIMSNLKDAFKGQDPMSFKIINAALRNVNKPEPTAPSIIMLLAAKGAEKVSYDFAQQLVTSISPTYLNITGAQYRGLHPVAGKKNIDKEISDGLKENELKAVLVNNIDLIPGEAAIMFYSYCDHENAPFKRVVYVMTVSSQNFSKNYKGNNWDQAAQSRLEEVWKDCESDLIAPLLARLTVSVAAISANP